MMSKRRWFTGLAALLLAMVAVDRAVRTLRQLPPDPFRRIPKPADDDVLADRVRSAIGQVEHRLDTPRVHVTVERGVVVLHGEVPSEAAAHVLERTIRKVPGVREVVSHLHTGLVTGDTRPSADQAMPSLAARHLVSAAEGAGAGEVTGHLAARAVVGTLAASLPASTARRLASHLPPDVASWVLAARAADATDSVDGFYGAVIEEGAVPSAHAPWVVHGVLRELAGLVGSDADAIAAALPTDLGHLWADAVVARIAEV